MPAVGRLWPSGDDNDNDDYDNDDDDYGDDDDDNDDDDDDNDDDDDDDDDNDNDDDDDDVDIDDDAGTVSEQVDIAVADITQTALRETAVDFTVPFDQVGITILYPVSFGYIYPKTAWEAKPFQSVSELVNQVCDGPTPDSVLSALCLSE